VIVLNGGSSSGKSGIARCLQQVLAGPWPAFSADNLVDAMPARPRGSEAGITFAPDGGVDAGEEFRAVEAAWTRGIAAMARAGARVVVEDVFLGGPADRRPGSAGSGPWPAWTCCGPGMAASQARIAHKGA
jgi:chloramphenicol 3-O phosphotransferase